VNKHRALPMIQFFSQWFELAPHPGFAAAPRAFEPNNGASVSLNATKHLEQILGEAIALQTINRGQSVNRNY
jgi:hypothetical protein